MKFSTMAWAFAVSVVWSAFPFAALAQDGYEERIEIHKQISHDDEDDGDRQRGGGDGEHRRGRGDGDGRTGGGEGGRRGGMRGHEGRRSHGGADPEMRENFKKVHALEMKVRKLAQAAGQGSDKEKAAIKNEAKQALGELYDAKLTLQSSMLAKMEKHVGELKAKLAKKKANRSKAIESRLARILGEGDDDWD